MKYRLTSLGRISLFFAVLALLFLALPLCSPKSKESTTGATTLEKVSLLHLKVQSENGTLIDGAEVYVNNEYKGKTSKYGESQGTETVVLEGDKNTVLIKKEGYFSSEPTSVSAAAEEQRLTLVLEKETARIQGVIKDVYGRLITGAVVTLEQSKRGEEKSLLTDEKGIALFKKITDGEYTVNVQKEGYFSKQTELKVNFEEKEEVKFTLILEKLPNLAVEVVDTNDHPLEEAEVSLYTRREYNSPGAMPAHIKHTGADGVVRFTDVELDEMYVLVVKKEGFFAKTTEKKVIGPDEVVLMEMEGE